MFRKSKANPARFDVASSSDPEVAQLVVTLCEEESERWYAPDPAAFEEGKALLRKDPEWNRRGLRVLLEITRHWRGAAEHLAHEHGQNLANAFANIQLLPGGDVAVARLMLAGEAINRLGRRRLHLDERDLLSLVGLFVEPCQIGGHGIKPVCAVMQAEFAAQRGSLSARVGSALRELRDELDGRRGADTKLVARLNQLLAATGFEADQRTISIPRPPGAPPAPACAGRADVLVDLKVRLGLAGAGDPPDCATEVIGPDRFPLRADSPLARAHHYLCELLEEYVGQRDYHDPSLDTRAAAPILDAAPSERSAIFLAACERAVHARTSAIDDAIDEAPAWQTRYTANALPAKLAELELDLDRDGLFDLLLFGSASGYRMLGPAGEVLAQVARQIQPGGPTPGERYVLHRVRCGAIKQPPLGVSPPDVRTLCALLGDPDGYWLVPGEHWADAVHRDVSDLPEVPRGAWFAIFKHAYTATASKPSPSWTKESSELLDALGAHIFRERCAAWLTLVAKGRSIPLIGAFSSDTRGAADTFNEGNATVLRGLVWMLTRVADPSTPRLIADLLVTSIKKVPGVGPRAVKVANACVWALGELAAAEDAAIRDGALGQLARLKARVTFKTTLKAIDKALELAAQRAGMSREDLEELGVPALQFEAGVRRATFADAAVELRAERQKVTTQWINAKGKAVKSAPAVIARDFKDDVKELKQTAKDAEGILGAGRNRLDTLYLLNKSWTASDWRERYLDHGLLGTLARRLIWMVGETPILFDGDQPTELAGNAAVLDRTAPVRLWHPVGRDRHEILGWRARIEAAQLTQPFKQAHREVYLLTDAERATEVYSNRYAAHLLKQHQFSALCAARGWTNKLRLMADDEYPPAYRDLPAWGLRAEFWIEGAGQQYGTDTNESGVYLYLTTDQVRFYRVGAEQVRAHAGGGGYARRADGMGRENINAPLALSQVPPLVFSEIMRDVDLFVGVTSVSNDPHWADGGAERPHHNYWHAFGFGDLSATAQTRKDVLERIVPRLKIAERCGFDEKFLVVRGDRRTYKIHLGSGNILMEPNDQYLCIVPANSSLDRATDKVFLPFEGDRTLAIILSKALLLAEDRKITDPSIASQIGR